MKRCHDRVAVLMGIKVGVNRNYRHLIITTIGNHDGIPWNPPYGYGSYYSRDVVMLLNHVNYLEKMVFVTELFFWLVKDLSIQTDFYFLQVTIDF